MWSVRVLSGPQTGQIFNLKMGKNSFGRSSESDFKVSSVGISKDHCEIHVYKDKVMVVDLKSSNGTFVNGVKIQNSIVKLGDKLGLFDVIMDIIPTPEIKVKPPVDEAKVRPLKQSPNRSRPLSRPAQIQSRPQGGFPMQGGNALQMQYPPNEFAQNSLQMNAVGAQTENNNFAAPVESNKSLAEKIENYIEKAVMPIFYKLAVALPFKQVLLGTMILFVLFVTIASVFPLTTIIKESNYIEASKRAKSVARAMARINEQALLSGQFTNLSVNEALKEEGIKDAFIIQQSDGSIVAPTEKVGRESSKPFIIQARKESRASAGMIDANTIGASYPIGAYDPVSGETSVKYHAVVYYDVSSLNVDDGRIISLFMQTLIISSVFGILLYFIFARLIEHPLKQLNLQIDTALRDKTDRTEVLFDYPEMQKIVANVNLLLNRMWNGLNESETVKPKQNRDIEFVNMVDMLSQPAMVIAASGTVIATNYQFEQLVQMDKHNLVQHHYNQIVDPAMVQNIEALMTKASLSIYEKQQDRIPFSQFECDIFAQACLDVNGTPEFYFISLMKVHTE